MSVSILITTFNRSALLYWGLYSIAKQELPEQTEIIVLNDGPDDGASRVCKRFENKINLKYIDTSVTKNSPSDWRVPGFALNIGAKKAEGEFLFISCAEMFHLDNCVKIMTDFMAENKKVLTIPNGKDDLNSQFLYNVQRTDGNPTVDDFNKCGVINIMIPFLMGMYKQDFIDIGGYDEDFVGVGFEDNNFVERMNRYGCRHVKIDTRAVHLYHKRVHGNDNDEIKRRMIINQNLLISRRGQIKANVGKEWGVL